MFKIPLKVACLFFLLFFAGQQNVQASVIYDLKEKISAGNSEIQQLEVEIEKYQEEIGRIGRQATTLDNALKQLNITDKKLGADIRITGKKINSTSLTIDKIAFEIADKEDRMENNSQALGDVIRKIDVLESVSFVEIIFSNENFSAFWNNVQQLERFQTSVRDNLKKLEFLKKELEVSKKQSEQEKKNLLSLSERFMDQKSIVEENKNIKARLLRETKNKESNYKKLLDGRLAQKKALEIEIEEFEARLRVEIDPKSLPDTGTGVLRWPLETTKITQYFGNTPFASKNPQVYKGKGHNGIDLRASVGTLVHAASSGTVTDIGDTDKQCFGASYGKWVLVRHYNGLSTLYAHLSLIRAVPAQEIMIGDIIGYSGNTGYSTGPHLHFAVFATRAVRVIDTYKSRVCGTFLKLPLSAQNGYLNPLSYLPQR